MKPFFVLAPMDDVTDTVFRQIVASCAPPDLFFTEFVNVDGLQSPGREALLPKLAKTGEDYKIIAQLWGKKPENFYKTTKEIIAMGYAGVDINFGCPDKTVVKNGCCSAMIQPEKREEALAIVRAVQDAAAGQIPVSVKTRLGFNEIDYSWHTALLSLKLNMLSIHARTRKQMSKVPADFSLLSPIIEARDRLSADTLITGNGDVVDRLHGLELAKKYRLDGIMIGRGIFANPYCFAEDPTIWQRLTPEKKISLYKKHISLHITTYPDGRKFEALKKFAKVYLHEFDGASDMRTAVVTARSRQEMLAALD